MEEKGLVEEAKKKGGGATARKASSILETVVEPSIGNEKGGCGNYEKKGKNQTNKENLLQDKKRVSGLFFWATPTGKTYH